MKSSKKILTLAFIAVLFSCSKDEPVPAPIVPVQVLPRAEVFQEKTTSVAILDATLVNEMSSKKETEISFTFNEADNPKVIDFKKIRLDLNLSHTFARDLEFSLVAPNAATTSFFIYRAGGPSNYIAANKLRFGAQFTNVIPNIGTTDSNLSGGGFKECKGDSYPEITLLPIFSVLQGQTVNGVWKLRITDHSVEDTGTIENVRLTFETGSIK